MNKNGLPVVAALLVVGAAAGFYAARTYLAAPERPGVSAGAETAPPALPPGMPALEDSDPLLREKAAALSADPAVAEWLKQDALIARLTAAFNRVAHGGTVRDLFSPLAPRGPFRVRTKDGATVADPASYARYDRLAALVASVDSVAAARAFESLEPLFDAAQRALGERETGARRVLLAALRELSEAPRIEGEPALVQGKKGLTWVYADAELEALSPARKQLLRLGPRNRAAVQVKARAIALALGETAPAP